MNFRRISGDIIKFIKTEIANRKSEGVVIGISGGIDSAVLAYLAVKALGNSKVLGLLLSDKDVTPSNDVDDALEVCNRLDIEYKKININDPKYAFFQLLDKTEDKIINGNLVARIRMCFLYYYAGLKNRLVLGSSNKTELTLGYFTKYGDGAADLLPLGDLYKTQITGLAKYVEVPHTIVEKKSSARLWSDQITEVELGLPFSQIDMIIDEMKKFEKFDEASDETQLADSLQIDKESIQKIKKLIIANSHKLSFPPICRIPTEY
jgi:NAD+ synthase